MSAPVRVMAGAFTGLAARDQSDAPRRRRRHKRCSSTGVSSCCCLCLQNTTSGHVYAGEGETEALWLHPMSSKCAWFASHVTAPGQQRAVVAVIHSARCCLVVWTPGTGPSTELPAMASAGTPAGKRGDVVVVTIPIGLQQHAMHIAVHLPKAGGQAQPA